MKIAKVADGRLYLFWGYPIHLEGFCDWLYLWRNRHFTFIESELDLEWNTGNHELCLGLLGFRVHIRWHVNTKRAKKTLDALKQQTEEIKAHPERLVPWEIPESPKRTRTEYLLDFYCEWIQLIPVTDIFRPLALAWRGWKGWSWWHFSLCTLEVGDYRSRLALLGFATEVTRLAKEK